MKKVTERGKAMREEWLVEILQKFNENDGRWLNAMSWYGDGSRRYARSEEEAKRALGKVYAMWNGERVYDKDGKRYETTAAGAIGVTVVSTRKEDDALRIIRHRIRKRIVSEWETIEEEGGE